MKRLMALMLIFALNLAKGMDLKEDILFKGKDYVGYQDICANEGVRYDGLINNFGQYACDIKYNEYGGVDLSRASSCKSEAQYIKSSGRVIFIRISFLGKHAVKMRDVFTRKYGEPKFSSQKILGDFREMYSWEDSKGGYARMSSFLFLNTSSDNDISDCVHLFITTSSMNIAEKELHDNSLRQYDGEIKRLSEDL